MTDFPEQRFHDYEDFSDTVTPPQELEVNGNKYVREELSGQHKLPYLSTESHDILLIPDPEIFDTPEERKLQVDVWEHNGDRYKQAGLSTVDQRFDENEELIDQGYETGFAEINGEQLPFLKCYYNPHLNSIDHVTNREELYRDKREEIIDAVITLDRLKRTGEIAIAENTADWEQIVNQLEVVTETEMPFEDTDMVTRAASKYEERPNGEGDYLLEDFKQALWNDEKVRDREGIYFKHEFNPRELVLNHTGLPSSSTGLINALKYNDKTGDIVVSDFGECPKGVFTEENNNQDVMIDSVEDFIQIHGLNRSTSRKNLTN